MGHFIVVMAAAASGTYTNGWTQLAKAFQAFIAAVSRIDVQNKKAATRGKTDIGTRIFVKFRYDLRLRRRRFLLPARINRMLAAASASLPFAAGAVAIFTNTVQHDDAKPHLRIMHRQLSSIFQTLTSVPFHV